MHVCMHGCMCVGVGMHACGVWKVDMKNRLHQSSPNSSRQGLSPIKSSLIWLSLTSLLALGIPFPHLPRLELQVGHYAHSTFMWVIGI